VPGIYHGARFLVAGTRSLSSPTNFARISDSVIRHRTDSVDNMPP